MSSCYPAVGLSPVPSFPAADSRCTENSLDHRHGHLWLTITYGLRPLIVASAAYFNNTGALVANVNPINMRPLALTIILSSFFASTSALPSAVSPSPLPLIIWHGLGDRYDADGLRSTGALAENVHPGTYVYYVRIDEDGSEDRTASFFGNLTSQVEKVCADIKADPKLHTDAHGELRVDALGFSQGGQFLRGLLQRCDGLNVRSLVTFGSQHNGIAQFQVCGALDFVCKGATALIKGNAWTEYVQSHVVPAQYYRTVNESTGLASDDYLLGSGFLADVNNERARKSEAYKRKIAALEKFVMVVFAEDATVIPKESGWFAEVNATSGEVVPLRNRTMYEEDWLGLRALDEKQGLVFRTVPGKHMELQSKMLVDTFREYFGPETALKGERWRGGGSTAEWRDEQDVFALGVPKDAL